MRHPQDLPCGKPGRTEKTSLGRLDDPTKFWKFDISDLEARDRWDEYMFAWQEVFEKTARLPHRGTSFRPITAGIREPWFELLRTTLKNMNMTSPPLNPRWDPDEVRRRLA